MSKRSAKRSNTDRDRESIPLESDWGDYHDDMEMAFAHRRFAGKQRSETLSYFDAPLLVSEDLESMPDIPFRYYVFVYEDYLRSGNSAGDADAASSFLHLVRGKLERMPGQILPVMGELLPLVEFVSSNQARYCADEEIYGKFAELKEEIICLYRGFDS